MLIKYAGTDRKPQATDLGKARAAVAVGVLETQVTGTWVGSPNESLFAKERLKDRPHEAHRKKSESA